MIWINEMRSSLSSIFRRAKAILKLSDMKSCLEMEKEYYKFPRQFSKSNIWKCKLLLKFLLVREDLLLEPCE